MKVRWRCTVCGWETRDKREKPPDICPVCGAGAEEFEPIEDEEY